MLSVVVGFIVINLAMLLLKLTKTVNIDIFQLLDIPDNGFGRVRRNR